MVPSAYQSLGNTVAYDYDGYVQPIFFFVQLSEDSSVWLQFLDFAGSQFPLFDLSFNLAIEFFCVVLTCNYTNTYRS